jgi:hypothetical protein
MFQHLKNCRTSWCALDLRDFAAAIESPRPKDARNHEENNTSVMFHARIRRGRILSSTVEHLVMRFKQRIIESDTSMIQEGF